MASIEFCQASKTYPGGVQALSDLSLTIEDGQFVVFVGPSGCGKTTALRMVAGLEAISSGEIRIGGRVVNGVPAADRDVAMVFQSYALYPHMTIYDNLAFSLKMRKTPKAEVRSRVTDAATLLGLGDLTKRRPAALSGGQRQRVALGRAIVRRPQSFLMDEPLSNLDAQLRVSTRVEILKLHQRLGTTFLYVTHDQVEAMTMGDRIAVMRDGVLQQFDTPATLYASPANIFVAGFVGSPMMNFLRVAVSTDAGSLFLSGDGVKIPVRESQLGPGLGRDAQFVLGVRPEHLLDARFTNGGMPTIRGRVEVVETLGSELHAHVTIGDHVVISRMEPRSKDLGPGQEVNLAVDIDQIHCFDPVSEAALR